VQVGNTNVTSIGGPVGWTTFSDGRYKKNIKENVPGLAFINSLRPITYTLDVNGLNNFYNKSRKQLPDSLKKVVAKSDLSAMNESDLSKNSANATSEIVHTGFVAQEVETAANKFNYDFSGVDKPKTQGGLYGLRYSEFVVPLVKAVQELSKSNDAKDQKLDAQQQQIDAQQQQINELTSKLNQFEAILTQCCARNSSAAQTTSTQNVILSGSDAASLEQNIPNPFNNTTVINYTLPRQFNSAQIIITDKSGNTLKLLKLESPGKGMVHVDASTLASGAYNYTLYVDGKLVGSRQMVLAK
jgi:hypothetical protein